MSVVKSPAQIAANSLKITTGYGGYCLKFCREVAGIPAKEPGAIQAWRNAKHKHTNLNTAPVGAFIFLDHKNSKWGHVAIYLGNGLMRTTNSVTNRIHTVTIKSWQNSGWKFLGWTEDLNGVRVPGLRPISTAKPKPAPAKPAPAKPAGLSKAEVRNLQSGLRRVFPGYRHSVSVRRGQLIDVDGSHGPQTRAWVSEFQGRVGIKRTGQVDAATRTALAKYGIKL